MTYFLERSRLQTLLDRVLDQHYRLIGPVERQGAIVYAPISRSEQLPVGVRDRHAPGEYRLEHHDSPLYFDWVSSAQGLKPWLFPPEENLWTASADDHSLNFMPAERADPPLAVLGVRACDLAGLALLDRHFLAPPYPDPRYLARREQLLLIAVNCHRSTEHCFCVSTGDGPQVSRGHDLLLDELEEGFVLQVGSDRGAALLAGWELPAATTSQLSRCEQGRQQARHQQRALPGRDLRSGLYGVQDKEALWQPVADRCLSCGNCTAVCPTCFCFRADTEASLDGRTSSAVRRWDSCFTDRHSYIVGKIVREERPHRYRQWLTHKLATWHEQYGRSGCVGCGRCISWCPVGIDLTAEARRLCQEDKDA